jgi:hypothetical protein
MERWSAPNAANGDYHIGAGSCVDAGSNQSWMNSTTDLGGNNRIINDRVDIGCYEFSRSVGTTVFVQ